MINGLLPTTVPPSGLRPFLEVIPECNWLQVLILEGANIKDKGTGIYSAHQGNIIWLLSSIFPLPLDPK